MSCPARVRQHDVDRRHRRHQHLRGQHRDVGIDTLTNPRLAEGSTNEIKPGLITLNAPSGFVFDTAATVTVSNSDTTALDAERVGATSSPCSGSASTSATVTSTQISIRVCDTAVAAGGLITWSGIKVRSTTGTAGTAQITRSIGTGFSAITGVSDSASWGALTVVVGAYHHVKVSPATATITAGGSQAYTYDKRDQYENLVGSLASATLSISPDGNCTGNSCTATTAGAHTVTATDGTKTGTATLTVNRSALHHLALSPSS